MNSIAQPTAQSQAASNSASSSPQKQSTSKISSGKASSPIGAVPEQPSYTFATKESSSPNASRPKSAIMANGGSAAVQMNNPDPTANGKSTITPAVPALGGAPTIVNGNNVLNAPGSSEHSRNPSFTVSNGASSGPQAKANNIQFGSMNTGSSPAPAGPANPSPNSLGVTAQMNPRQTSPQTSPSPIPQPAAASGGRPPSSLQGQGNGLSFGSIGGDSNDPSVSG